MTSIVLIETNGTVKSLKAKDVSFDTLYRKCGFRVSENFIFRNKWRTTIEGTPLTVELWAKDDGKSGSENKYDFPPPVDKALYFGTCALIQTEETVVDGEERSIVNLTTELWKKIYEKLFGGFEEIGDEDEYSEDELAHVSKDKKTKNGYLKDGFVVDSKSDEGEDDNDADESDSDSDSDSDNDNDNDNDDNDDEDTSSHSDVVGSDSTNSELEEEEYEYSSDEDVGTVEK